MGGKVWDSSFVPIRKVEEAQPPPLYEPVLGQIEVGVNDDPENLIVHGMVETYDLILAHQIREFIRLWYRAYDASRVTFISGTVVAVPLKIL